MRDPIENLQRRLNRVASAHKKNYSREEINQQAGYDVADAVSVTSYERMDGEMVIDVYYYTQNARRVMNIVNTLENEYAFTSKVRATNDQVVGTKVALQLSFGKVQRNPALKHPSGEVRSCLRQLNIRLKREFGEDLTFIHA
jgi:hypothetical protein